eukprot:8690310-Prorocentrum_lima.AAC.1
MEQEKHLKEATAKSDQSEALTQPSRAIHMLAEKCTQLLNGVPPLVHPVWRRRQHQGSKWRNSSRPAL